MRVHCYEHPNEPMERFDFAYVGDDLISIRYKCKNKDCKFKVEIILNKEVVIEKGIENL